MNTSSRIVVSALLVLAAFVAGGLGIAQAWGGSNAMSGWMSGGRVGGSAPAGWMMNPQTTAGTGGMMGGSTIPQDPSAATPVAANTDSIVNFTFSPVKLQVRTGTTVTWTNRDSAPHTVTFSDTSLTSSGILRYGDTFRHTFTKAGAFTYDCALHPYMKGTVIVAP